MITRAFLMCWLVVTASLALAQGDEDREGGIIGTGIVGTITKLGSIHVNGQRITFDDTEHVVGSVPSIMAKDLQPGQTVAVVAMPRDNAWHAHHIRQVLPVVGPVTTIAADHLVVMGTKVVLGDLEIDLVVGEWVAVSGLWRDAHIRASAIARVPAADRTARISGSYLGTDHQGRAVIGETLVTGISPTHLSIGDLVRVQGEATPTGINASRLETGLFGEPVELVQVQGYYSPPQPDGLYTVLGSGMVAYTEMPEMISTTDRVIACGTNGLLGAPTNSTPRADDSGKLVCRP